jgi:hypothetical protein
MTHVLGDVLIKHGAPAGAIMSLHDIPYPRLKKRITTQSRLCELSSKSEHVRIGVYERRLVYRIDKDMPGIRVNGHHFILGRVNRDVLSELRINIWPGEAIALGDDDWWGPANPGDLVSGDLMVSYVHATEEGIDRFFELIENPDKLLDAATAGRYREEYIDRRWEEEFEIFVAKLVNDGILLVDSSGVGETITALYHMAQRKSGKKSVIKKSGKVVFPTDDVFQSIDRDMMMRAFSLTEHAKYTDPDQVFRITGGAE